VRRPTGSDGCTGGDLVLASRPAGDQVVFNVQQAGLSFAPDGQGGFMAARARAQSNDRLRA
jgi:hypothetical protein